MRTFSGSYYANLFQVLDCLKVGTRVHRFHYSFYNGSNQYFQFFSNFHRIIPCLANAVSANVFALVCYLWYTIAIFLFPPRLQDIKADQYETETLEQYTRRIWLPDVFLNWYLLPLFSSVATCSHEDLRNCPAAYIGNYRKRTIGAHHRTVADMRVLQGCLTQNVNLMLQTEVYSISPDTKKVELQYSQINEPGQKTEIFDCVIIATSAKEAGKLFPTISPITRDLREGRVRVSVTKRTSENQLDHPTSERLILRTQKDSNLGLVTRSEHHHPSGVDVVVSSCLEYERQHMASNAEHITYLSRPLPTPKSHELLLSVMGRGSANEYTGWRNGDGGIYLAGGYASASLPLLEACVRSGLEAAIAIGANLPFDLVRYTPF